MKLRYEAITKGRWLRTGLLVGLLSTSAYAQRPRTVPAQRVTPAPTQRTSSFSPEKEAQAQLEAGQAAYEQGRFEEALRAYNKVMALAGTQPKTAATASLRMGNVYMSERQYDRALAAYERACALNPNYAEAFNHLGEALGQTRQYNRALEVFSKAVVLDPLLLRARYNSGITYGRLNNLKYAEFVFRVLVRDHPEYDLGCDGYAVTLAKSGRAKEAIPFHLKAISLNPIEPSYYYNLALSYLIIGDTAKAVEQQQKLQELAPEVASQLASVIVKHQLH
jgi:tetratricopeptide (TPR) repeat protein